MISPFLPSALPPPLPLHPSLPSLSPSLLRLLKNPSRYFERQPHWCDSLSPYQVRDLTPLLVAFTLVSPSRSISHMITLYILSASLYRSLSLFSYRSLHIMPFSIKISSENIVGAKLTLYTTSPFCSHTTDHVSVLGSNLFVQYTLATFPIIFRLTGSRPITIRVQSNICPTTGHFRCLYEVSDSFTGVMVPCGSPPLPQY